jgi:MFS family permease
VLGPTIAAVGFALFALPGLKSGSYWITFFPAAVVLGVGLSLQAPAVTTVALNSVKASHSGLASAINNAFSQTAGLLAIAVLGVLMFATFDANLDDRLATLELSPATRQQLEEERIKLGAAQAPESLDAVQGATVDRAIDEAYVAGYRTVMLVAAAMSLASAVSAALLIEGKRSEEAEAAPGEEEALHRVLTQT